MAAQTIAISIASPVAGRYVVMRTVEVVCPVLVIMTSAGVVPCDRTDVKLASDIAVVKLTV